jgi:hypothetical protein
LSSGSLGAENVLAGGGSFSAGHDAPNPRLGRFKRKGVSKTIQSMATGPAREISPVEPTYLLDANN